MTLKKQDFNAVRKGPNMKDSAEADSHPVFAAIIDLYLFEMVFTLVYSFISHFIVSAQLETIFLIIGIVIIITIIAYHSHFSKQILYLSPGEILGGRIVIDDKKLWYNPYGINRFGIYFISILTVLLFRDSHVLTRPLGSFEEMIAFLVRTILVFIGLILIGKGKLKGIVVLDSILIVSFGISILFDHPYFRFSAVISLIILVLFSAIGVFYHYNRKI